MINQWELETVRAQADKYAAYLDLYEQAENDIYNIKALQLKERVQTSGGGDISERVERIETELQAYAEHITEALAEIATSRSRALLAIEKGLTDPEDGLAGTQKRMRGGGLQEQPQGK